MKQQTRYTFDTPRGTVNCQCLTELNICLEREAKNGYRPEHIHTYKMTPAGETHYYRPYPKWLERRYFV